MVDVSDLLTPPTQPYNAALPQVVGNIDEDPDKAQRAYDLAKITGAPATSIYGDLDEFERNTKAKIATDIVGNNPHIANFVQSDPMVPKIFANSYGFLDDVSAKLDALRLSNIAYPGDPLKRFREGAIGAEGLSDDDIKNHPVMSGVLAAVMTPIDLVSRTILTGVDAIKNVATAVGGESLGRDVGAIGELEAFGLSGRGHGPAELSGIAHEIYVRNQGLKEASDAASVALWLENKRMPPPSVLPEWDKFLADTNAKDIERLMDATKASGTVPERTTSPELYRQFIADHTDAQISVSGEAIAKLYGDKVPEPDDNLLGWAPDIAKQLELARATGDDVSIPLADWLTHIPDYPEVAKALEDDIRVRPEGITANEAKLAAEQEAATGPRPPPLPGEMPAVRAASALEPMLSIGDRPLKLERMNNKAFDPRGIAENVGLEYDELSPEIQQTLQEQAVNNKANHLAQGFHDFYLLDEKGNKVGYLNISEQKGGKDLYVDMISGVNGLGPRDFGPALMRDLKRQLKAEFPNAERLGGHRVSGAREAAGKEMTMPAAWIKLDVSNLDKVEHESLRQILEGGQWETFSPATRAYIKPQFERTEADRNLVNFVNSELNRIVPKKVTVKGVEQIKVDASGVEGQRAGEDIKAGGIYLRYRSAYPVILYALDSNDALGTGRHEAIHHLRQYGFFNPTEWERLKKAAIDNGWMDKYNIHKLYPTGSLELKLEESIAERFKDWSRDNDIAGMTAEDVGVFQRLKDFLTAIKTHIAQMLGKAEPTWEDIFKKVDTGEIGSREGTTPIDPRSFDEKLAVENFRKAANDNEAKLNTQSFTDELQKHFKETVTDPHEEFIRRYDELHAFGEFMSQKGNWTELNVARYNKMGREMDSEWTDVEYDPLGTRKKYPDSLDEKLSVTPPGGSRPYERAAALGMPIEAFKAYDKFNQAKYAEDVAKAEARAAKEQARQQTKEWKDNRIEVRKEVADSIRNRPDVATDLFLAGDGLYGRKRGMAYKLDADRLTDKQKGMLPPEYYAKGGLDPDDVAPMFGFGSGDAMVDKLSNYSVGRLMAGMKSKDYVNRVIDVETDRQMKLRYGNLDENIMDAAKEQALGEVQQNLVHEETLYYASKIGEQPANKDNIMAAVRQAFGESKLSGVSSERMMRKIGQLGRATEAARLKEDWQGAFRAAQQREYAMAVAAEAVKVEKEQAKFDKLAKKYAKRFDPTKKTGVDADFSLFIRDILSKVERSYGMSVQGLAEAIGDSHYPGGLKEFVEKTNADYGLEGVELPVADWLQQPGAHKAFGDLSVDEFRELNVSVKALDTFGRKVKTWTDQGNKAELDDLIGQMGTQLKTKFPTVQDFGATGKPGLTRRFIAAHLGMETMFARFDGRDPHGLFTKTFAYPAARAGNAKDALDREFSKKMKDIPVIKDLGKKIDSPLIDPRTGAPVKDFTLGNMMAIIHNMGNDYNWRTFTKSWNADPNLLRAWVERNSTPEMFDRAQAMGKLFDDAYERSRNVYSNLYGIAPERIPVQPFTIHGRTYEGWYHPLIRDDVRSPLKEDSLDQPAYQNFWPSTANAYTKARTGAVYTLSLSSDMIPIKLNQMLHDIAFREFVHESAKIIRNKSFKDNLSKHYGPEYVEALDMWIKKVAGNASYDSTSMAMAARLSNTLRQNVIASHIGWSLTTIEKHGPTAALFSMKEVGAKAFIRTFAETTPSMFADAVMDLFGKSRSLGDSITKFIENNSEEIKRRDQNFQETVSGVHNIQLGNPTYRQRAIQLGSKGVAFSDRLSADPTWFAKYREELADHGDVGLATDVANRAVRRAHGSTSVTNAPGIVSNRGVLAPWISTIYGFWGTRMQRMFEIAHDVSDAYHLGRDGQIRSAAAMVPQIATSTFVYVLWPAIVEEMVSSQFYDDKSKGGLLSHALRYSVGTIAQSIIGLRDLVYGIENNREPAVGMISTLAHDPTQLIRDAKKNRPFDKANAGKFIQDAITTIGDFRGIGTQHLGSILRYSHDLARGVQKPKSAGDVYRGFVTGKQEKGHN